MRQPEPFRVTWGKASHWGRLAIVVQLVLVSAMLGLLGLGWWAFAGMNGAFPPFD